MATATHKSKLRKFAGFGFWILLLNLLKQISTLGASVALARTLSKDQFGSYQFVVSIIGICGVFTLPGMQNVIVQSVARGFSGTFKRANFWTWRVSALGGLLLFGCGAWEWCQGKTDVALALMAGGLLFPHSNGIANWQSYQNGREQFKTTALYQGSSLIVGNGLIIGACLLGTIQVWIPVVLFYGVLAVQNLRMTYGIIRSIPPDAPVEPSAIEYGFRISLYNIANVVGNYLDRILLFYLISPEALAAYAVADRAPEILKSSLQSLTNALIPEMSRRARYSKSLDRRFNRVGLLLCGAIVLAIFFVIPWLLPLLYSDRFSSSVLYCQLLLVSMCLGMFATLKFSYIQAKMDARSARGVTLTMSFCRIVFSLILVPFLGALGAALATIAYRFVTFSLVHYYLKKYHMAEELTKQGI